MGENWEELKGDPLMRDLRTILAQGLLDFSTDKLTTLPTLLGDEGRPADTRLVRAKVLSLLTQGEPAQDPPPFEKLGQHTQFSLTLFGATPQSRMHSLTARREAAGEICRPEVGMTADAIRRRPSAKQPSGGKEWRLLCSVRDGLLAHLDRPPAPEAASSELAQSLAAEFFTEGYVRNSHRFREALDSSRSLSMLGFSHNRMAVTYAAELSQLMERGGRLHVLTLDPSEQVVLDANLRSYAPKKAEAVRHQHEAAIATLTAIGERATQAENFQVFLMNCTPPFTIYLFDEDADEDAQAFVWLTPWRVPSPERPGFCLTAKQDGAWYEFFANQLGTMWAHFAERQ